MNFPWQYFDNRDYDKGILVTTDGTIEFEFSPTGRLIVEEQLERAPGSVIGLAVRDLEGWQAECVRADGGFSRLRFVFNSPIVCVHMIRGNCLKT